MSTMSYKVSDFIECGELEIRIEYNFHSVSD